MQTELTSRIEKVWAMAEIALSQGTLDYGSDGHSKIARLCGLKFKFIDGTLVRVRGSRLDIAISHHKPQKDVVFFPGAETILQFLVGDDKALTRSHRELTAMQTLFSTKKAA